MIKSVTKKSVTESSYPFASAHGKLDFEKNGYVEEEYFFRGTANVYEESGKHEKIIIHGNNPYTNRFLVRRPEDMSRFSGNVVVEILNATAGFDLDRMWVLGATELTRDGAVYIGITSRPEMIESLRLFDPERYQEMDWTIAFDREDIPWEDVDLATPKHNDRDTGLFWDMLTELTSYLKTEQEIIPSEVKKYFYLIGWSQSANYMSTYIRYFQKEGVFDGYLAAGNIHHFTTPLNQEGFRKERDFRLTKIDEMPVPYIAVQTESENAHFCGYECRQEDSDSENFYYRVYEIAGATHDTKYSLLDYYEGDESMKETGLTPKYEGVHELPNDYPYQYPIYAVYRHLFRWVRNGICPPPSARIEIDGERNNCTDQYGNAAGGVRTPFLEVPSRVYHNSSKMRLPDGTEGENPLFGYVELFTAETMKELYGDIQAYQERALESVDEQIRDGFLLEEDREAIIEKAVEFAKETGLE